jgi:hypothetical protein
MDAEAPSYLRFLHEYKKAYKVIVGDGEVNYNACFCSKGPKLLYEYCNMVPSYLRFLHEYRNVHEVILGYGEANIGPNL